MAATLQVGLNVMLPDGKDINRVKLVYALNNHSFLLI